VRGLSLTVVDHGPTLSRLDGERLGVTVSGLRHAVHRGKVAPSYATYRAYGLIGSADLDTTTSQAVAVACTALS
jgi:hypothetical protein